MRVIGRGDADACLSGGAESKLNTMGMLRQHFAGRLAAVPPGTSAAEAASRVRPFAPDACGTVLGEAGAILVLEAMESALARGVQANVELAGFGASQCSCIDTVGMDLSASGPDIAAAIDAALGDAGIPASDVDAIVPIGMGHAATDRAEAAALREAFGDRLASIPLVTLTPMLGACGAGASALAVIVGAECISRQLLPARLSTSRSGELGLDADARPARGADLRTVLTLSTGLGGQNAAVVLRRTS
jgi:3-oxoacyl-(acyl-carrier-protein) synthase